MNYCDKVVILITVIIIDWWRPFCG